MWRFINCWLIQLILYKSFYWYTYANRYFIKPKKRTFCGIMKDMGAQTTCSDKCIHKNRFASEMEWFKFYYGSFINTKCAECRTLPRWAHLTGRFSIPFKDLT